MSRTSRNYCFTSWNKLQYDTSKVKYICYGEELCPKTAKLHYQGYVEFYSPLRICAVKKIFNDDTIHLESRKGTKKQAIDYCKKDGKFFEYAPSDNSNTKEDANLNMPEVYSSGCNQCLSLRKEKYKNIIYSDKEGYYRGDDKCIMRIGMQLMHLYCNDCRKVYDNECSQKYVNIFG